MFWGCFPCKKIVHGGREKREGGRVKVTTEVNTSLDGVRVTGSLRFMVSTACIEIEPKGHLKEGK